MAALMCQFTKESCLLPQHIFQYRRLVIFMQEFLSNADIAFCNGPRFPYFYFQGGQHAVQIVFQYQDFSSFLFLTTLIIY